MTGTLWPGVVVCAYVCVAAPLVARAECVLEGVTTVRSMQPDGSDSRVDVRERMRVMLRGAGAQLEGVAPLAFRGTAASTDVELHLARSRVLNGIVGVARGTAVSVERVVGSVAVVRVRDESGEGSVSVGGLRVACSELTSDAGDRDTTPIPVHSPRAGWIPSTTAHEVQRCTSARHGLRSCFTVIANRCAPVGDGSICGYRVRARALTMFAAPRAGAPRARVGPSRDLVLADEDGRAGWLLVRARVSPESSVALRGWVHTSELVWRQEQPRMELGRVGVLLGRTAELPAPRAGWVRVRGDSEISDAAARPWARTVEPYCAAAVQEVGSNLVHVELPGALRGSSGDASEGLVSQERAEWVASCAR